MRQESRSTSYRKNDLVSIGRHYIRAFSVEVGFLKRSKRLCNAVTAKYDKKWLIYINSSIPNELKVFSLFHELCHIKYNKINVDCSRYDFKLEQYINFRALMMLKHVIGPFRLLVCIPVLVLPEKYLYGILKKITCLNIGDEKWKQLTDIQ